MPHSNWPVNMAYGVLEIWNLDRSVDIRLCLFRLARLWARLITWGINNISTTNYPVIIEPVDLQ